GHDIIPACELPPFECYIPFDDDGALHPLIAVELYASLINIAQFCKWTNPARKIRHSNRLYIFPHILIPHVMPHTDDADRAEPVVEFQNRAAMNHVMIGENLPSCDI